MCIVSPFLLLVLIRSQSEKKEQPNAEENMEVKVITTEAEITTATAEPQKGWIRKTEVTHGWRTSAKKILKRGAGSH